MLKSRHRGHRVILCALCGSICSIGLLENSQGIFPADFADVHGQEPLTYPMGAQGQGTYFIFLYTIVFQKWGDLYFLEKAEKGIGAPQRGLFRRKIRSGERRAPGPMQRILGWTMSYTNVIP